MDNDDFFSVSILFCFGVCLFIPFGCGLYKSFIFLCNIYQSFEPFLLCALLNLFYLDIFIYIYDCVALQTPQKHIYTLYQQYLLKIAFENVEGDCFKLCRFAKAQLCNFCMDSRSLSDTDCAYYTPLFCARLFVFCIFL